MVMNINLKDANFDADKLYENAKKVGLNLEELEEFGFDLKGKTCNKNVCFNMPKIKGLEDVQRLTKKFAEIAKDNIEE